MTGQTAAHLGVVMLCHTALDRAVEVARHWARAGCPVVLHIDSKVSANAYRRCVAALADVPLVQVSERFRCDWGGWGLVAASQSASAQLLRAHPGVQHVYLTSGSCLPLRPVSDLVAYLRARPDTDFIESATTADARWTVGGLDHERFTLHFPFSWRHQRWLFDRCVTLQRHLRIRRSVPAGITPHLGSQWWCLTRRTLTAIAQDPERASFERYFKGVWIPDESYFQTLARRHSACLESRSLTLSKFDFQGKPHLFYDDHLELLRQSDCFVARKIWPRADALYTTFLADPPPVQSHAEPNTGQIDRVFARAARRRTRGRPGLYMQSRFPNPDWENGLTARPYVVCQGFGELFDAFEHWVTEVADVQMHGHLFAPEHVGFAKTRDGAQAVASGALPANPRLRDANPRGFLTNLIWNNRHQPQGFCFGPADRQEILWSLTRDANATIAVISGAWAVPLFRAGQPARSVRRQAARLQNSEAEILYALRSPQTKANVEIWTLADFVEAPAKRLSCLLRAIAPQHASRMHPAPRMVDLTGFGQFLQDLRNQGMHPYLTGEFPVQGTERAPDKHIASAPALVR